jgi:hypothetical protein
MEDFFNFRTLYGFSPFGKTANLQLLYYNRLHNKTLDYDDWVKVFYQLEKDLNIRFTAYEVKFFSTAYSIFHNSLRGRGLKNSHERDSNALHSISSAILFVDYLKQNHNETFKKTGIKEFVIGILLHDIGEIIAEIATSDEVNVHKLITKPEKDIIEESVFEKIIPILGFIASLDNRALIKSAIKELTAIQEDSNPERVKFKDKESFSNFWKEVLGDKKIEELDAFYSIYNLAQFHLSDGLLSNQGEYGRLIKSYQEIEDPKNPNPLWLLAKALEKIQGLIVYDNSSEKSAEYVLKKLKSTIYEGPVSIFLQKTRAWIQAKVEAKNENPSTTIKSSQQSKPASL